MITLEAFLNERVRNGKEAEKRICPERLVELRNEWSADNSMAQYLRWFNALQDEEKIIALGWEAQVAKEA